MQQLTHGLHICEAVACALVGHGVVIVKPHRGSLSALGTILARSDMPSIGQAPRRELEAVTVSFSRFGVTHHQGTGIRAEPSTSLAKLNTFLV